MTMKDVLILIKLLTILISGIFIQASLGLFLGLLLLPNLKENIEFIYLNHFSEMGIDYFSISLVFGTVIVLLLTFFISFYIPFKIIDLTMGWSDLKEKFPKIFKKK